ncbi:MAG TPA: sulfite exporter TauE/SafE family protein [Planktothrix sp.]|jgi:uncharacterized membrane protein YfcA
MNSTATVPVKQSLSVTVRVNRKLHWAWALPVFAVVWTVVFVLTEPDPAAALRQHWAIIPIGFCSGVVANISALGGGIVAIPAMMFLLGYSPIVALKTTIGTQSIGMSIGSISWLRTGNLPVRAIKYAVPGLLIGSSISSEIIHANAMIIKGIFGPVSIVLGILALATLRQRNGEREDIPDEARLPLFLVSIIGGLITGWIAIGEGEVIAAMLMIVYGVSPKRSIALGVVLLCINSIYLMLNHVMFLGGVPWQIVLYNIGGAMFGAWITPRLAKHLNLRVMKIIFANIAILDGILFMYQCSRAGH